MRGGQCGRKVELPALSAIRAAALALRVEPRRPLANSVTPVLEARRPYRCEPTRPHRGVGTSTTTGSAGGRSTSSTLALELRGPLLAAIGAVAARCSGCRPPPGMCPRSQSPPPRSDSRSANTPPRRDRRGTPTASATVCGRSRNAASAPAAPASLRTPAFRRQFGTSQNSGGEIVHS